MEYGRLVVLGYSSYRVATVGGSAPPRSEVPASQQSFGLGVATGGEHISSAQQQASGGATAEPAVTRRPPVSVDRNVVASSSSNNVPLSRTGSSSSSKKSLGQLWEPIGDQNAQYILQKRKRANGVSLSHFHHFCQKKAAAAAASTPVAPVFAAGSLSSSSSSSAARVSSKDLKVVTKRMMQAVDMKRTIHNQHHHQSEENTDNNSEAATSSSSSSNSTSDGSNGVKAPGGVDSPFLMCVPMNDKDVHASVTEYRLDATTDMFQIGRMPCRQNDFVIPGPRVGASGTISRFAARILCSREPPFECRLFAGGFDVARKMTTAGHALKYCTGCSTWFKKLPLDHSCVTTQLLQGPLERSNRSSRVSGSSQRSSAASLSASASASASPMRRGRESNQSSHTTTRETIITTSGDMNHLEMELRDSSDIPIDGVTKNGVRVWLPEHKQWFEVSVNGNLYAIQSRTAPSTPPKSSSRHASPSSSVGGAGAGVVRHSTFNRPSAGSDGVPPILTDGAIIDLGGVQLQFQTSYRSPSQLAASLQVDQEETFLGRRTNSSVVDQLERLNIQCPVQLHSLRFTRPEPGEETDPLEIPHVFPACGHVFGYEERIANSRMCPLCRHPGFLVKLLLKENSQLQSAAERNTIPECVLNPCGHAISSKLASHYSKLLMPNGRAICPFCAVHLHPTTPFSRLYLYSEDEDSNQQA